MAEKVSVDQWLDDMYDKFKRRPTPFEVKEAGFHLYAKAEEVESTGIMRMIALVDSTPLASFYRVVPQLEHKKRKENVEYENRYINNSLFVVDSDEAFVLSLVGNYDRIF